MKNHRLQAAAFRRHRTPDEIARLLDDHRQSGLSLLAFADKHQLCYSTLLRWRQQLPQCPPPAGRGRSIGPAFVPVQIEPGSLSADYVLSWPAGRSYDLEATNPCGEQWLGPYENCCLGSINLAQHVRPDHQVDWRKLEESIVLSTRFLDNVVDANQYVPAVPQLQEAAYRARRIGLGIMGLGDLMYHLGIRYSSEEAHEFASQVMEFVRYHCMKTSVQLAKERGAFPAIAGSLYDPKDLKWTPPQSLTEYQHDWNRPAIDWHEIVKGLKQLPMTTGHRRATTNARV